MSSFDDRRDAFEKRFAKDEEFRFKVHARCTKLLALWAAQKIGLPEEKALEYALSMVEESLVLKGDWNIKTKVQFDLKQHGVSVTAEELESQYKIFFDKAEAQLKQELRPTD